MTSHTSKPPTQVGLPTRHSEAFWLASWARLIPGEGGLPRGLHGAVGGVCCRPELGGACAGPSPARGLPTPSRPGFLCPLALALLARPSEAAGTQLSPSFHQCPSGVSGCSARSASSRGHLEHARQDIGLPGRPGSAGLQWEHSPTITRDLWGLLPQLDRVSGWGLCGPSRRPLWRGRHPGDHR